MWETKNYQRKQLINSKYRKSNEKEKFKINKKFWGGGVNHTISLRKIFQYYLTE